MTHPRRPGPGGPNPSGDPAVTAIVIFLDEERFLPEAVASVLSQTYREWELLLVDDGSRDGSTEVARQAARQFPERIRYLEHPGHQNRGMSASRNLGLRHARGRYVAFLDADDVWMPNTLAEQVATLATHPEAAFVYGPLRVWYSWTGEPDDQGRDYYYGFGPQGIHPYPDQLVLPPRLVPLILEDHFFTPGGLLAQRAALEAVGGYIESFRGNYEDTALLVKLCLRFPVYVSSRSWYQYRKHPASWTTRTLERGGMEADESRFLEWVGSYLRDQRVRDRDVWRALRRARRRLHHPGLATLLDARQHWARVRRLGRRLAARALRFTGWTAKSAPPT
jgi:glycosyltransferase involved in cell wall biosynthesis